MGWLQEGLEITMLGFIHTLLGFLALFSGWVVFLQPKGTRWHVRVGRVYVYSMLGLNLTAFGIYELFGRFGIFHWFALVSLVTLIGGMLPMYLKRHVQHWIYYHYHFMAWSYLGLLAATSNEAFVHIPYLHSLAGKMPVLPWLVVGLMATVGGFLIPSKANQVIRKVKPS